MKFSLSRFSSGIPRVIRFLPCLVLFLTFPVLAAPEPPLKICLLSASAEYESEKSLTEFQKYLETNYSVTCQRAFGKDKGEGLPGLDALKSSDLMIVFTRRVKLAPDQLELVKKYIESGRPIIGIRTASHAFENFMELDREILGGGYKGHYANDPAQVSLVPGKSNHPVLLGVAPFASRKLYKNPTLAEDVSVLLIGSTTNYSEPVAWVRDRAQGRVFYTSLGAPEDFANENFRRLLVNAIFWTTERDEATSRLSK